MSYLEILGMIGLGLGCGLSKLGIPAALVFSPILASVGICGNNYYSSYCL